MPNIEKQIHSNSIRSKRENQETDKRELSMRERERDCDGIIHNIVRKKNRANAKPVL